MLCYLKNVAKEFSHCEWILKGRILHFVGLFNNKGKVRKMPLLAGHLDKSFFCL